MSLNKFMHPRNLYKKRKPNFKELALKYPEFRSYLEQNLSGKLVLDFKNPAALRLLSTILLKEDLGLEVDIPTNRLVPTIPLRLNYIHWIEDLIVSHQSSLPVQGIDIGTGSCCIYPLLGHKLNGWKFLATELDEESAAKAIENVEKNNFQDSITIKKVSKLESLRSVVEETNETYDFCMCNPPFYSNEEEPVVASPFNKRAAPHAAATASSVESVTWGGEYQFVNQLIQDSLVLRNRVRIYTSMVGKKQNLLALKYELRSLKVPVFSSTEFCQGKTMRWGLGWSFDESVSFTKSYFKAEKKKEKMPLALCIPTEIAIDFLTLCIHIKELLQELKINYVETKSNKWILIMSLFATENTWSHQRRQRRQRLREEQRKLSLAKDCEKATPSFNPTCTSSSSSSSTSVNSDSKVCQPGLSTESVDGSGCCISDSCGTGKKPVSKESEDAAVESIVEEEASSSSSIETVTATSSAKRKRELESYKEDEDGETTAASSNKRGRRGELGVSGGQETECQVDCTSEGGREKEECNENRDVQPKRDRCSNAADVARCSLSKESEAKKDYLFQCTMFVKRKLTYMQLELALVEGDNREMLHQLLQFFRNKLLP
ncbi:RNA N6-adenosine-methyltransferase mettl16 isoform X2 [Octopus bimaculoides]|nr:RNA N6-adenosine-methyltransferase mettl16 isoform X2 [Octopus bimaculoides]XP_014770837.1 RNA N6-adenosine-methyltransferase mettl16 isoform X2 [Octopus bimaculoides]XP_052832697.1 RNA N6-adenosine-methyltransferase mettl16 isoform X2 [Octopus bimaculoides]|eukprot:XP_014770836.1 PREDICTED: methyltransferase-like protein 16 isoform X2 [Octopus bimaculoides]